MRQKNPPFSFSYSSYSSYSSEKTSTFFFTPAQLHCSLNGRALVSSCWTYSISLLQFNQAQIWDSAIAFLMMEKKGWPVVFSMFVFAGARNIFWKEVPKLITQKKGPAQSHRLQNFIVEATSNPTAMELPTTTFLYFVHKTSETNMHCHDLRKYSRSHDLNFCNLHSFRPSLQLYQTMII